jgi:hypothetical protein
MKLRFWSDAGSDVTEIPPARTFENAEAIPRWFPPLNAALWLAPLAIWTVLIIGLSWWAGWRPSWGGWW